MEKTVSIQRQKVDDIIKLAFKIGEVRIFESYSDMDEEIIEIKNYSNYLDYFQESINKKKKYIAFGLYYEEAAGYWQIQKTVLDPEYCDGKTFRYTIEGWGIIYIQLDLTEEQIECRIAANTEKRTQKWESTHPELKSPDLWNWKIVASKARKLIRELKK
ncbi:hypothetical protein ACWGOQ_0019980 [Aquimarina sp. M1]